MGFIGVRLSKEEESILDKLALARGLKNRSQLIKTLIKEADQDEVLPLLREVKKETRFIAELLPFVRRWAFRSYGMSAQVAQCNLSQEEAKEAQDYIESELRKMELNLSIEEKKE